jgi:hypothetical protein
MGRIGGANRCIAQHGFIASLRDEDAASFSILTSHPLHLYESLPIFDAHARLRDRGAEASPCYELFSARL